MLSQRDSMNTDAIANLSDKMQELMIKIRVRRQAIDKIIKVIILKIMTWHIFLICFFISTFRAEFYDFFTFSITTSC
jgi:hypothetical protein